METLEKVIISLLETRGNLSFKKSGVDNRRETMPVKRSNLKNRLSIKFNGKKSQKDEELLSKIAAQSKGVTINKTPFATVEDEDFGIKRTKTHADLNYLKQVYSTIEHENLHSTLQRYIEKKGINFNNLKTIVDEIIVAANLTEEEQDSFERFKLSLDEFGKQVGAVIDISKNGDEQLAYLLDYLNNKEFRECIKEFFYSVLKNEGVYLLDLEEIESALRKFDIDLKRIWKKIRETVKRL